MGEIIGGRRNMLLGILKEQQQISGRPSGVIGEIMPRRNFCEVLLRPVMMRSTVLMGIFWSGSGIRHFLMKRRSSHREHRFPDAIPEPWPGIWTSTGDDNFVCVLTGGDDHGYFWILAASGLRSASAGREGAGREGKKEARGSKGEDEVFWQRMKRLLTEILWNNTHRPLNLKQGWSLQVNTDEEDRPDFAVILDRSGSMESICDDAIGSLMHFSKPGRGVLRIHSWVLSFLIMSTGPGNRVCRFLKLNLWLTNHLSPGGIRLSWMQSGRWSGRLRSGHMRVRRWWLLFSPMVMRMLWLSRGWNRYDP